MNSNTRLRGFDYHSIDKRLIERCFADEFGMCMRVLITDSPCMRVQLTGNPSMRVQLTDYPCMRVLFTEALYMRVHVIDTPCTTHMVRMLQKSIVCVCTRDGITVDIA